MDRRAFLRASLEGNLTEPQLRQVHNILTAHIPEQIVTIFNDADQFRPLLIPKLNDGDSFGFPGQSIPSQELYVNLTMRTTPPRQAFIAVLEEFRHGRLKVAPITGALAAVTPPLHVDRFGTSEVRWRLFTDVTHRDILPTKIKRFGSRELLYNEHEAAWKLFRVIVEDYGHILNSSHSNIDWISVSREMGRPYEIDRQFTAYLYVIYFDYVAPIVALWLWEIDIVMKRQMVASQFVHRWHIVLKPPAEPISTLVSASPSIPQQRLNPSAPITLQSSHKLTPTTLVMTAIHESFTCLNNALYSPLTLQQLAILALHDPLSYVRTVATQQSLRAVIRQLPEQPLELICDVTQWVLDNHQTYFPERPEIIKLLQDLSHGLPIGKLPQNLTSVIRHPSRTWKDGGEAYLKCGKIGQSVFAIRVHKYPESQRRDLVYLTDKRVKRSIILQRQFRHPNLIGIYGVSYDEDVPSLVMPCMYSNLQEYALEQDSERGQLIRDVCSGVGYLHQNRQVHGDLHWGNVLIERLPNATRALLADFGMSRVTFANQNSTSTEAYWSKMVLFMPLEIRQVVNANLQRRMERGTTSGAQETEYKIRPDLQTDIFSFAVVIMALSVASLRSRVGDLNTQESGMLDSEVNRLRSNSYLPQLVYFGVRDFDGFMVLIRRMLSDTKATRPSMTEVRNILPRVTTMPTPLQ